MAHIIYSSKAFNIIVFFLCVISLKEMYFRWSIVVVLLSLSFRIRNIFILFDVTLFELRAVWKYDYNVFLFFFFDWYRHVMVVIGCRFISGWLVFTTYRHHTQTHAPTFFIAVDMQFVVDKYRVLLSRHLNVLIFSSQK